MDLQRVLREMREIGRAMADPDTAPPNDEIDGFELAASARTFSNATREIVDDKLSFSAALMRAGEVDEANRILAEVEHEVRNEEAVLLEKMNEVSARRAVGRAYMTRNRLVRLLATAMVGAGLLGMSAMGMAVAGMFDERDRVRPEGRRGAQVADAAGPRPSKKKVMLGDVALKLSKKDLRTLRALTTGTVDAATLEHFLSTDLDLPANVVDEALATVFSLAAPVVDRVEKVLPTVTPDVEIDVAVIEEAQKKAEKTAEKPSEPAEPAEKEAEPSPSPDDSPPNDGDQDGDGEGDGEGRDGDDDGNAASDLGLKSL